MLILSDLSNLESEGSWDSFELPRALVGGAEKFDNVGIRALLRLVAQEGKHGCELLSRILDYLELVVLVENGHCSPEERLAEFAEAMAELGGHLAAFLQLGAAAISFIDIIDIALQHLLNPQDQVNVSIWRVNLQRTGS